VVAVRFTTTSNKSDVHLTVDDVKSAAVADAIVDGALVGSH
jgi:hypothetical protein